MCAVGLARIRLALLKPDPLEMLHYLLCPFFPQKSTHCRRTCFLTFYQMMGIETVASTSF